jgi:tRNA G18 (ribose-2'-O)-methylase SpoU
MQCSLRVLPLRRPFTELRPALAQFPRQASLTSAINRGIRKTRGGVDSLERRTSARPSRDVEEDSTRRPTWRAGSGDKEGTGKPDRGFTQRSRDTERSGDRYGRGQESSKWQPRSENVRRDDRAQGTYSNQRQTEREDYGSKRTPRSSPFDRDNFRNTRDEGGQSTNRVQSNDGPNRKERRAVVFGTKTWSDSSPRERHGTQTNHAFRPKDSREPLEQFTAENVEFNRLEASAGRESLVSFGSNRYTKEIRSRPAPRRARDGHDRLQDYGQVSDRSSRRRRNIEQEGGRDAFDEVRRPSRPAQPHVKVPLSVPYTTAGSEFLYGTHVVKAALQSGRRKLYKLYIYQGVNSQGEEVEQDNSMFKLALAAGVAVSKVTGEWERLLNKMSDQRPHNGYVLEASPVPKLPVTALESVEGPSETFQVQLGHQSAEELAINSTFDIHDSLASMPSVGGTQRYPFLLMLDRIRDPGNLGSIIRSSYFLGAEAIVMIEHGTAPIGPVALKSSASAAENLPLLMVKNEHAFMRKSQENGWKFFAATSPDSSSAGLDGSKPLPLRDMTTALQEGPCVLLLGSEGEGIRPQLQRIVNGTVGVESGRGSAQGLDSLNVGVAAALLMQEFLHGSQRVASESKGPSDKGVLQPAPEKLFEF